MPDARWGPLKAQPPPVGGAVLGEVPVQCHPHHLTMVQNYVLSPKPPRVINRAILTNHLILDAIRYRDATSNIDMYAWDYTVVSFHKALRHFSSEKCASSLVQARTFGEDDLKLNSQ
ncbi:hypothetical protein TNCV_1778621 [Trichonephila clavipes]|nr:hypothetical protein TNCV_1778621 [Trichonephila clavipes]